MGPVRWCQGGALYTGARRGKLLGTWEIQGEGFLSSILHLAGAAVVSGFYLSSSFSVNIEAKMLVMPH